MLFGILTRSFSLQVALKTSDAHVRAAAILVEVGKIDINLKNTEGKAAWELAISSDMRAVCEPYVDSTFLSSMDASFKKAL